MMSPIVRGLSKNVVDSNWLRVAGAPVPDAARFRLPLSGRVAAHRVSDQQGILPKTGANVGREQ